MNHKKHPDPVITDQKAASLPEDLQAASQAVMAALAQKRAQRKAAWAMGDVPKIEAVMSRATPTEAPMPSPTPKAAPKAVEVTENVSRQIPTLTDMVQSRNEGIITPEIRARVEAMRTEIETLLPDLQANTTPLTADEVVETVANMQAQEKDWERLPISEIRIPRQEVSLWGGFLKILNHGITERASNREFGK